jgi:hypothetical protein
MSSAGKELIVNPLERALSGDIVRLQNFSQAMMSEMMRAILDTGQGSDDESAAGSWSQNTSQGNPAWAEVLSGLVFTPVVGGTSSAVSAGAMFMYDPDTIPSTDDSQYKYLLDPGTTSALTPSLTLTANASGSIRVDVLECARVQPDTVVETDSRDVFNTVTGTFAAAAVNKVSQGQLQYRIRTGTAGAGFPGTAAGWMPIAVMSVPTGTTTWDTVTVWDVRPLLNDRIFTPWNTSRALPVYTRLDFSSNTATSGQYRANGFVEASATLGTRRLGGWLERGSPGVDHAGYVDFYDSANQESGYAFPAGMSFLYLVTMFSLPRWARYTDASFGVRQPRSPRGIPILSATGPLHWTGSQSAGIVLPAVFGFAGAASTSGVCIGAVYKTSSSTFTSITSSNRAQSPNANPASLANATGVTTGAVSFTLAENAVGGMPAGAKRVRLQVGLELTLPSTTSIEATVNWSLRNSADTSTGDGYTVPGDSMYLPNSTGSPVSIVKNILSPWLALETAYPILTAAQSYLGTLAVGSSIINTGVTPTIACVEWEF